MPHHWCWRRVCNRTPKTFDLVKIRAKPLKIWAKSLEIWAKCVKTFTRLLYVVWIYKNGSQNESADLVLFLIIWRSCFLGKLGEIWSSLGEIWVKMFACSRLIWQNAPNMKWNAVVFLEVIFWIFFRQVGEIWAKILRTQKNFKNLPAVAPVCHINRFPNQYLLDTSGENSSIPGHTEKILSPFGWPIVKFYAVTCSR